MSNVIQFPQKNRKKCLIVNTKTGKITASGGGNDHLTAEDRVERIRTSLEKINRLMTELRRMEETR